jgi:hypothetical protein
VHLFGFTVEIILSIWQVLTGSGAVNMLTANSREHLTIGGPQVLGGRGSEEG